MEIHKPHPIHGWRDFLKEYGIIVLGVLTALAGEQTVEALHHRGEVRELRQALDEELSFHMARMQESVDGGDCAVQRVAELDRWSRSLASGKPLKLLGPIHVQPGGTFRTSVFRSATGTTFEHMPLEVRTAYAEFYDGVQNNVAFRTRLAEAWIDLADYQDARALTPDQQRQVTHDLNSIRLLNPVIAGNYAIWRNTYAPPLGIKPNDGAAKGMAATLFERARAEFCKPLLAG